MDDPSTSVKRLLQAAARLDVGNSAPPESPRDALAFAPTDPPPQTSDGAIDLEGDAEHCACCAGGAYVGDEHAPCSACGHARLAHVARDELEEGDELEGDELEEGTSRALLRLAIAQHWCRGALSYLPGDPWKPIVTACALAALAARDLEELRRLLGDVVGRVPASSSTANVWRSCLAELADVEQGVGAAIEGAYEWPWPLVLAKTSQLFDAAQADAEQLRTPSMVPPASIS
jgi:hypothetical protein